jgi:hypothetical protein
MEGNSLVPNIFAAVAQWESEVNGQRTKDALMQKFIEGWQPTPLPIGYRSIGGEKEKKTCEPDPYVAPIIKEMFELYATGNYSIVEITDWLKDQNIISKNGTPLGHSVVCNLLNNPFYYSLIRWHGQSKIGNHTPIISKNLFDTCQYVLAKHRNFLLRRRVHDFLLRGFIYCEECGQRYTAEWHKNEKKFAKRGGKIAYYHCKKMNRNGCSSPYVEMTELEKQVEVEFKNMQFSEEFIQAVVQEARKRLEDSRKQAGSIKQGLLNQKVALEAKRNKLEDALVDGLIDRDVFKRKHTELQEKITNIELQMQEAESNNQLDVELIDEILAFTRNIYKTYKEAPGFLKRHYLRFFYEKLVVENKEVVDAIPIHT